MLYNIGGIYKKLNYKISSNERGSSYEVLDYGVVTGNPISIMSGSSGNPNEYTEEIIKQKIDDYLKGE